jgi:hypothetical protein
MVERTPHPNPPPHGGRGFLITTEKIPSPFEGEGWEGGKPREEPRQQAR